MSTKSKAITPNVELLQEIALLSTFSASELQEVLNLGQHLKHEAYSNIIIEGELSWGLYLVLDGEVGIFKANKVSGNVFDVAQLGKGTAFGEMSLVDDSPRSASVRALVDTQTFYLSREEFDKFLNQNKDRKIKFMEGSMKLVISRLRELDENFIVSQYQLWRAVIKNEGEHAA